MGGVERRDRIVESGRNNMRVDLRCGEARVTEDALGFEEIAAEVSQLRRAGVPKRVPANSSQLGALTEPMNRIFGDSLGQG